MSRHKFWRNSIIVFLSFWMWSQYSIAGVVSPVTQLQGIANRMVQSLERNKSRLSNMSVIRRIVNRNLLPNVDLNRMSASVVGRYWRGASGSQRAAFKKEFAYLVTTTYAAALSSYDNDRVRFYPLRVNYQNRRTVNVRSLIVRSNGQRIPVNYDLVRQGSRWKVYDFSIENVSMVQSYRSQFAGVLSSRGFPGLLQQLKQHNSR